MPLVDQAIEYPFVFLDDRLQVLFPVQQFTYDHVALVFKLVEGL
jgi:hypothetical protein